MMVPFTRLFLSTLSLRRATAGADCSGPVPRFLSTLSLRRATQTHSRHFAGFSKFLSTLSLRRATGRHRGDNRSPVHFYPRSPCGERRRCRAASSAALTISIHALLAESDFTGAGWLQIIYNFYPRSPCGERPTTILRHCTM